MGNLRLMSVMPLFAMRTIVCVCERESLGPLRSLIGGPHAVWCNPVPNVRKSCCLEGVPHGSTATGMLVPNCHYSRGTVPDFILAGEDFISQ